MKLYLKKELLPLANGEATSMLSEIESKESEVERLTKEMVFLKSSWQSAYNDAFLLGEEIKSGRYEFKDHETLQERLKGYQEQFNRIDAEFTSKKAELEARKSELTELTNSFNEKYVEIEGSELI